MKVENLVIQLTRFSPHALLFTMIATFFIAGTFQAQRLGHHGLLLSIAIATTVQLIRVASGLTSAGFFRAGDNGRAAMSLMFSLSITIFETYYEQHSEIILMIWSGLFLELFLGLSVKKD